jgi:ribonuclease R
MQQASYNTANVGHFALAARDYLHFTSPIRRYPDLAVHRVVRALVRRERLDKRALLETLDVQAAASSRLERRAMLVDREANDLYRTLLMKERIGERFDATITGVAEHGLYVTFDAPFVEAKIPIDTLGEDWYELDSLGLKLVGRRSGHTFVLGDRVTVRIEHVSIAERAISAVIEESLPSDRELLSPERARRRRRASEAPRRERTVASERDRGRRRDGSARGAGAGRSDARGKREGGPGRSDARGKREGGAGPGRSDARPAGERKGAKAKGHAGAKAKGHAGAKAKGHAGAKAKGHAGTKAKDRKKRSRRR